MGGGAIVRHRLDDAAVEIESGFDQFLAVTCRAGAYDVKFRLRLLSFRFKPCESVFHGFDGVTEVHGVILEDDLSRFLSKGTHGDNLCCRGAGVYSDDNLFLATVHRVDLGGILVLGSQPLLVFFL